MSPAAAAELSREHGDVLVRCSVGTRIRLTGNATHDWQHASSV